MFFPLIQINLSKKKKIKFDYQKINFKHQKIFFDRYQPGGPGFDPKWPKTHFLPQSTWFNPYSPMNMVLTRNDMKLIFYPGRYGLTRWTRF